MMELLIIVASLLLFILMLAAGYFITMKKKWIGFIILVLIPTGLYAGLLYESLLQGDTLGALLFGTVFGILLILYTYFTFLDVVQGKWNQGEINE